MQNFSDSEAFENVDSEDIKINLDKMEPACLNNTGNSDSIACMASGDIRIKEEYENNTRNSMVAEISEEYANFCKDCSKICYPKDLNEKFVCRECCPLKNTTSDLEEGNTADESESYKNIEIIKVEEPTISNVAITCQAVSKLDVKASKKLNADEYVKKLKKSYICTICPEVLRRPYKTPSLARRHIKMMHFGYRFECRECTVKYTNSTNLKNHYKTQHGKENHVKIELTNYELEDYGKLDVNEHVKKLDGFFVCGLCPEYKDMRYKAACVLKRHIKIIHYGHRYACPDCNAKYLTLVSLKSHYKNVHDTEDASSLHVELSGGYKLLPISHQLVKERSAPMPKDLNAEKMSSFIKNVNDSFICTLCPKNKSLNFKTIQYVRRHIRYKHYGYSYKCAECSKTYACTSGLKKHYTIQHHIRAPTTNKLTKSYELSVQTNKTKKQIRKIGNHYICRVCPKTNTVKYTNIVSVKRHIKVQHLGYRYECSVCGAKYKQQATIRRHYRLEHNREGGIKTILTKYFRRDLEKLYKQQEIKLIQQLSSLQSGYVRKKFGKIGSYYFCRLCSTKQDNAQKYKRLENVVRHIEITHHGYRYHCTECGAKYSDLNNLKNHYKRKHKIEAPADIELAKLDGEDI